MARGAAGVPAAATQQRRARSAPAGSRDFCQVRERKRASPQSRRRGAARRAGCLSLGRDRGGEGSHTNPRQSSSGTCEK
ncbi:unnamed protein product [Rangifer tarandus platyrhynchus]|uniref:Uncharacterized protein n=1 Tax=Rangifer tarandus platyrhynchus TaxID=3082113 RepID=A0ABN8ZGB8_RANTA|nr:unnamed protein product [Rangifer tarandus platyrhynchus]CAI9689230.1 unnamed protein product [Rangifer tarandus platyrhynchus]